MVEGRLGEQDIKDFLDQLDIADVIGSFIQIEKHGRNFRAVCPFHNDSDPSLQITPSKKIFKCFPCGVGGTAISFVQKYKNINFYEAVDFLATKYNIKIKNFKFEKREKKYSDAEEKLFALNEELKKIFMAQKIVRNAKEYLEYLKSRKFTDADIKKFEIGIFNIPPGELYKILIKKSHDEQTIIDSGIIYKKGTSFDSNYFNRIVFPILNEDGKTIGFSARTIIKDEKPKYINSRENLIFKKSHLLYNYFHASEFIRQKNEVIILEGFMDVIALNRIGIKNAIAIMGTNLSDEQIKIISHSTKKFKLFLDGDDPGINATIKAAKKLLDFNYDVEIVKNPTDKDPDELVIENKTKEINDMIANPNHVVDFTINYYKAKTDFSDIKSVDKFISECLDLLKRIGNPIVQKMGIQKISELSKVDINSLSDQLAKLSGVNIKQDFYPNFIPEEEEFQEPFPDELSEIPNIQEETFNFKDINQFKYELVQKRLINDLIKNDKFLTEIERILYKFKNKIYLKIAKFIINEYNHKTYKGNNFNYLIQKFTDYDETLLDELYSIWNNCFSQTMNKKEFNEILQTLDEYEINQELEEIAIKIKKTTDEKEKLQLTRKFEVYIRKRSNLKTNK
ncbi:DNA primase [Spiroplasma endosymbiont of Crioceris asparagi]|uniref:DNA primase n=1 Tax=Spiroplasma endosymbiont of Crioceris asparagi TaxID=3066286 RepID=UPI0030D00B13